MRVISNRILTFLRGLLGDSSKDRIDIPPLPADANPWDVPMWDLRPVTQHLAACSQEPKAAQNARSYSGHDGRELSSQVPSEPD